jgi:hypothetical protein
VKTIVHLLAALIFTVASCSSLAASWISGAAEGVAIQGYDAVAYHTQKADMKGSPKYTHEWASTVWHFSSEENQKLFATAPEKYAPQYGGYCALSVANGGTSQGAGDAWTLRDGKLYLNGSKDVRARWVANQNKNIYWADRNWPDIKRQLEAR